MQPTTALLLDLVELAPDAMLLIDSAGQILYANQQVSTLFGYEPTALVGQAVECLLPERFRARHGQHRARFASNSQRRAMGADRELYGRRRDSSEFPVEISLSPLSTGLIAAAIRDVTDRNRVKRELIAAREAADLAREEADQANLTKSRFLAAASHDLRQPLQSLSMLNGALRRQDLSPHLAEVVVQQEQAIEAMKRLLNALLDICKLESGAIKPCPIDCSLPALFDRLCSDFANVAAEGRLKLRIDARGLFVNTDPALLEQVLRNLLANAIKYTLQGVIDLRATMEGNQVRIDVQDTGIGIAAEQLALIFDEFYQIGVPTNSKRRGYGLGLTIVQRIVTLLDARLEVKSELGRGSTFTLMLPKGASEAARPQASLARLAFTATNGRVLIVEDEPSVRVATQLLLRTDGYEVVAVASRAEALKQVAANGAFDVLVTDYHLSGTETGLEVIADLREQLGRLPAVLVTGDTSSTLRKLPLDPDFRLASKPIDADELLTMVRELREESLRIP